MELFDEVATLDFETKPIAGNVSVSAPEPVGLAIRWAGGRTEYLSWGHPAGNNCTRDEARRAWMHACKGPVLFHNAKFDMEVARQHFGVPYPLEWHDTLFVLFLSDPDALSYSLKPAAERYLNEPPTERDAVFDWILKNVKGTTKKNAGAYISLAPVALVAPYAIGDVERTYRLFVQLFPAILSGQPKPYDRERRLLPHLVSAETRGIRCDTKLLDAWYEKLAPALVRCDDMLRAKLNAPTLNLDSNDDLANVLLLEGLLRDNTELTVFQATGVEGLTQVIQPFHLKSDADLMSMLPTLAPPPAKRSMAKASLRRDCVDAELVNELEYRNTLATMLRTFIVPWRDYACADGRLHTTWHQVRGVDKNGTRTGRIASAEPNLANTPNVSTIMPPWGLPFLPALRAALLPEDGDVWVKADYSQQELRLTAHFEDGEMMRAYQQNPALDLHAMASQLIKDRIGLDVPRKRTKTVAFASIYGAGLAQLAAQLDCSQEEAASIRMAYFRILPGLQALINKVKQQSQLNQYITSLGGRIIPLERPKIIEGRLRDFAYKQINRLVQGSAADQTKEAIVCLCESGWSNAFRAQCYDEINLSVPENKVPEAAASLQHYMTHSLPTDVPMLVDVATGPNHASLTPWTPESGES